MLLFKKTRLIKYLIGVLLLSLLYTFTISTDRLPSEYINIFDFKHYIDIVKNFSYHFQNQNFTPYYNSRLLMPGLMHYLFELLGIEYNFQNIQNGFLMLNFLSIMIALYYFLKIAKIKKYSQEITILGLSFLFINFFILKFSSYYPILMDVFGFTSGILLYYLYIIDNKPKFYIFMVISMFIFPTTILIALSLIVSNLIRFKTNGLKVQKYLSRYIFLILIPVIVFLSFFCYHYYHKLDSMHLGIQLSKRLIPATLLFFFCFIFFLLKNGLSLMDGISINFKGVLSLKLIIPLFIIAFYFLTSKYLSYNFHAQDTLSLNKFIFNLTYQVISFPLKFLITNFIYYGAFIIFLLIFRKDFFLYAKDLNPFLKILTVLFIVFSFGTETRQFLQIFPFIVLIFMDSIKKYNFNIKLLLGIFAFQLIWSRFWYMINSQNGFFGDDLTYLDLLGSPAQRYFQFQGPWLSTSNSAIYGGIFIMIYFIIDFLAKKYVSKPKDIIINNENSN